MKKSLLSIIFLSTLLLVFGQQKTPDAAPQTLRITGTRLVHPIFRKWIEQYARLHPELSIQLDSKIPADSADLLIASHILRPSDLKEGQSSIILNRYVQLPVVNSRRSDVAVLQTRGFAEGDLRRVYFAGNADPVPADYHFAVYKREKPACASMAFANHFGNEQKDIKGTGVVGDDRDLLEAVKKDTNGISYNNLGFLYDLNTRKPVDGIAIIPLDLNGNGRIDPSENIYGNLDQVIAFAEKTRNPQLLTEDVHVIFSRVNPNKALAGFLQWILTEGQQYDHAYGFLVPAKETLYEQQQVLAAIGPVKQ